MLNTAAFKEDVMILPFDDNADKFSQADTSFQVSLAQDLADPIQIKSEIGNDRRSPYPYPYSTSETLYVYDCSQLGIPACPHMIQTHRL